MVSAIHEVNQWGRKDPFTPAISSTAWNNGTEVQIYKADGTAITKGPDGIGTLDEHEFKLDNTITTTINHLIQNPSTHYSKGPKFNQVPIASAGYNTDKEGDWWNPTIKTIYDPCPNGYRIPKEGTYGEVNEWTIPDPYSVLTAGYTWNNNDISFFPASGFRLYESGMFYGVGSEGVYWMSTPKGTTRGSDMIFTYKAIIPNTAHGRSLGCPTRCIKE